MSCREGVWRERGVREGFKAWAAKDGVALSSDGMRIQRGKVRSSVLDTEGEGCLLHKPCGRKGCAQACIQTGALEWPVGRLNPDPLPLIPLLPPPSIIPGFLGLQHGRTDPRPGKVAFLQAPGLSASRQCHSINPLPPVQARRAASMCGGGGTLQATGTCYTPTANQSWSQELVAHAVSPSTLGPLVVILESGRQRSFDGREHLGAMGRDVGATLQASQRARPWDGYSKNGMLSIQSPKGTVQWIHETMPGRTKTIKKTEFQWLRLHASTARGGGWIPGPGNIIPHAKWYNPLKKIEVKLYFNKNFFF